MITKMLEYVNNNIGIKQTILMNTGTDDPNWSLSMLAVACKVAEHVGMDELEPEFEGLWDAVCEIVRGDVTVDEMEQVKDELWHRNHRGHYLLQSDIPAN